jgi:hypothetical protein
VLGEGRGGLKGEKGKASPRAPLPKEPAGGLKFKLERE